MVKVLRVWEAWSLYPQVFLARLHDTFLRKDLQEHMKAQEQEKEQTPPPLRSGAVADAPCSVPLEILRAPGIPVDEQLDGKPLEDEIVQQLLGRNLLSLDEVLFPVYRYC